MEVPFRDGLREIPDHLGDLMKAHKIPTWEMDYDQALDQVNLLNVEQVVNRAADRTISEHLKVWG